jgi:hypothetical protein
MSFLVRLSQICETLSRDHEAQGRCVMGQYQVYLRDTEGLVLRFLVIEAESDKDAVIVARQYVDGCDVEVLQSNRLIAVLTPKTIASRQTV